MLARAAHLSRTRYRAARGVSFLEVVFATFILAMAVATMASAVNAISNQQSRSRQLLACAELANRLIIQYLDDENSLPPDGLGVPYGDEEFRWRKKVTRVDSVLDETIARVAEEAQSSRQLPQSPDRLKKVAITVWLSEQSGGSRLPDTGAPQVTMVRVVDPLAFHRRTPDSIENLMEQGTERIFERILGNDTELDE